MLNEQLADSDQSEDEDQFVRKIPKHHENEDEEKVKKITKEDFDQFN
jgi:hypothetical protein